MRNMGKKLLMSLTVTALLTSLALAQTANNPPSTATRIQHRVNFLTTVLSLTTAQQQQATTIFTNAANSNAGLQASFKTARQQMKTAVQNNDTATIDSTATTIGNLVAQMAATKAKAYAAFYQILTPDQQTKAAQLQSQMGGRFGHKGPGM